MEQRIQMALKGYTYPQGGLGVQGMSDLLRDAGFNVPHKSSRRVVEDMLQKYINGDIVRLQAVASLDEARNVVTLDSALLDTLAFLHASPREVGGLIDLKLNGMLDKVVYTIGDQTSVELDRDFEIIFHTHPTRPEWPYDGPSRSDILTARRHNHPQVDLVLAHEAIYAMYIDNDAPDITYDDLKHIPFKSGIYHDWLRSHGIHVMTHTSGRPTGRNTRKNWPDTLPLLLTPYEPPPTGHTLENMVHAILDSKYHLGAGETDSKKLALIVKTAQPGEVRNKIKTYLTAENYIDDADSDFVADALVAIAATARSRLSRATSEEKLVRRILSKYYVLDGLDLDTLLGKIYKYGSDTNKILSETQRWITTYYLPSPVVEIASKELVAALEKKQKP